MFSDVWSENGALFKRLMKINSNLPILYYGIKKLCFYSILNRTRVARVDSFVDALKKIHSDFNWPLPVIGSPSANKSE